MCFAVTQSFPQHKKISFIPQVRATHSRLWVILERGLLLRRKIRGAGSQSRHKSPQAWLRQLHPQMLSRRMGESRQTFPQIQELKLTCSPPQQLHLNTHLNPPSPPLALEHHLSQVINLRYFGVFLQWKVVFFCLLALTCCVFVNTIIFSVAQFQEHSPPLTSTWQHEGWMCVKRWPFIDQINITSPAEVSWLLGDQKQQKYPGTPARLLISSFPVPAEQRRGWVSEHFLHLPGQNLTRRPSYVHLFFIYFSL